MTALDKTRAAGRPHDSGAPGRDPLIVADAAIALVEEAFSGLGRLRLLGSQEMTARNVRDAEILLVRTETRVDESLLSDSRVRFVGSPSVGVDHVDLDYLGRRGITFAHSPGCNADAVAQYTLTALLWVMRAIGARPERTSLGVVGVGHIGGRVVRLARAIGFEVVENDPPRARCEPGPRWHSLDDLSRCDLITLHVPLQASGPDATHHLFDGPRISRLGRGCWILNTSRGAVVDNSALKSALAGGKLGGAVLDVWENEPAIDFDLLRRVGLGTAHIASRTQEGWIRATEMVYRAACHLLNVSPSWKGVGTLPCGPETAVRPGPAYEAVEALIESCYDIARDDAALRALETQSRQQQSARFRELRTRTPQRREWSAFRVSVSRENLETLDLLERLGFGVVRA